MNVKRLDIIKNIIKPLIYLHYFLKREDPMKILLSYLKPYTKLLIIGPLFKLIEAILELILPYLMSKIIDIGVANNDTGYVIRMGLLMLGIAFVGISCALICQYSASIVSQGTGTSIRNALFEKIAIFSNTELDKYGTASLTNRITNDVNQVQLAVAMLIRLVIRAPFLCIGGLVMAALIDIHLFTIMIIVLPIFIFILVIIMKKSVPLYGKVQQKLDNISLVLRENLSGVRVIRAFAREDHEKNRFSLENEEYAINSMKVGKISGLLNPLTNLIMNFAIGAILWFGSIRVDIGRLTTGQVIAFIGYVAQILAALIVISNLVVIFTKAFASANRIIEVFETETSIESSVLLSEKAGSDHRTMNIPKEATENSEYIVEFTDVSLNYDEESEAAIEHITFQVRKGETIGVIGGTGSGKSSIINLIPRFYDVSKGSVKIYGKDVRKYDIQSLRAMTGVVPQKSVLFTGTISENIRWGKEDATDEEIKNAADIAMASEFIEKLPDGYKTMISRGGVNLSGGQRQRLTIARALVRKPAILLLDDSFSALDFVTDSRLRKGIKEYTKNMTTFIVSQRASTIRNADKIIVLDDGAIVGIGNHEKLIQDCELYKEICQSQMQENGVN